MYWDCAQISDDHSEWFRTLLSGYGEVALPRTVPFRRMEPEPPVLFRGLNSLSDEPAAASADASVCVSLI
jgi:hypothetical protein